MRKRRRHVTVVMNAQTGKVLAMAPHRNPAALKGFFIEQRRCCCDIVVSDGSMPYDKAIDAHLGEVTPVLDRYHVIRWFSAGLSAVRRELQGREPYGVTPEFDGAPPGPVQSRVLR